MTTLRVDENRLRAICKDNCTLDLEKMLKISPELDLDAKYSIPTDPWCPSSYEEEYWTMLGVACISGSRSTVDLLLTSGASPTVGDYFGRSPLFMASSMNYPAVVASLLRHINNDDDVLRENNMGVSPIIAACSAGHLDVVRLLVQRVPRCVNGSSDSSTLPLVAACRSGSIELIQYLIDSGACVEKCDPRGIRPVHAACFSSPVAHRIALLRYFIHTAVVDLSAKDNKGRTPLHFLLEQRPRRADDLTVRLQAALLLIERGADLYCTDSSHRQAIDCIDSSDCDTRQALLHAAQMAAEEEQLK